MAKKVVASETPVTEPEVEPVAEQEPETFDQWLEKQPEDAKARYAENTKGLTSALHSERETRKELEKGAKKLAELEKAEAEKARAQLSETERLKAERDDALKAVETAKGEAKTARIRSAIEAKAAMLGFADSQDAYLMIDSGSIELDARGNAQGIDELLNDLAKAKPYLVTKPERVVRSTLNPGGAGPVTETDAERRRRLGF